MPRASQWGRAGAILPTACHVRKAKPEPEVHRNELCQALCNTQLTMKDAKASRKQLDNQGKSMRIRLLAKEQALLLFWLQASSRVPCMCVQEVNPGKRSFAEVLADLQSVCRGAAPSPGRQRAVTLSVAWLGLHASSLNAQELLQVVLSPSIAIAEHAPFGARCTLSPANMDSTCLLSSCNRPSCAQFHLEHRHIQGDLLRC